MKPMNPTTQGRLAGAALLSAMLLVGCEVTNPGAVEDQYLAEEQAQPGLINGAHRSIAETIGGRVLELGYMAREIFPGGQTGAWGADVAEHAGHQQEFNGPPFNALQQARFISAVAIDRFTEVDASDDRLFHAHLWNGWAYRMLGEWFCDAVLPNRDPAVQDPPAWSPDDVNPYFERAVESFTNALDYATDDDQENAALAGRAQAYLWLGNWSGAYADAAAVDDEAFSFVVDQGDSETNLYNYIYEGNSGTFRSYSTRFTWFEQHYLDTGDPRTPSYIDPDHPVAVGSLSGYGGSVPYRPQSKYTSRTDAFELAGYWEMQLVQAEAILRGAGSGSVGDAVALINDVRTRTGIGLAPVTAADAAEAWDHLMTERRIELWLEGRNAPDERRWTRNPPFAGADVQAMLEIPDWENDLPRPDGGYTPLWEQQPRGLEGRGPAELCYDIPQGERDRNPNIPASGR